jgi:PAS domain S-box-containing protein
MAATRVRHHRPQATKPPIDSVRLDGRDLAELVIRAADGAFASGADGRIVLWNRAAERMLGWSAKETLGQSWGTLFTGEESEAGRSRRPARRVAGLARVDEPVRHCERKIRTKSGRPLWLDITIFQVPGSNGVGPLAIHLLRDLTAIKALLEIVNARAVSSMRFRNRSGLSPRENEVLALMSGGGSTRAMAERLRVSRATIRNHIQNILTKLDVHSRLAAVAWAHRHRLV